MNRNSNPVRNTFFFCGFCRIFHMFISSRYNNADDELIELSQGKRVRIEEIDGEIDRLDGEQGAQAGEEIGYLTKERSDILLLNRSKRIRRTNSDG